MIVYLHRSIRSDEGLTLEKTSANFPYEVDKSKFFTSRKNFIEN